MISLRKKVAEYTARGLDSHEIANKLHISVPSVAAYKAHNTREHRGQEELADYLAKQGNYLVVETKKLDSLSDQDAGELVRILLSLEEKRTRPAASLDSEIHDFRDLKPSQIREQVLEMVREGYDSEEIYEAFPSKLKQSVASYLAHVTMGTYHERGLL